MKTEISRKCVYCGGIVGKQALIRIVRDKSGRVSLDPDGNARGRGAYICRKIGCVEGAFKKNALERSFRSHIDDEIKKELLFELRGMGFE